MDTQGQLSRIDWDAPWFEPWRETGERVASRCVADGPLHEALNAEKSAPVQFVPAEGLPAGASYESHIFATRTCPTRENLHDFFNGLAWLAFPQSKRRLNQLQAAELQAGSREVRGPVRDAITVFDENGALLAGPAPLWQALASRDWRGLFVDLRPLWRDAALIVFGHALLEKLAAPRKALTAHVWHVPAPDGSMHTLDGWLAAQLTESALSAKPFAPLPVMGIPGWCPNDDSRFYDDARVFRPPG